MKTNLVIWLLVAISLLQLFPSCEACFGVEMGLVVPGKIRGVRQGFVGEFILSFNVNERKPQFSELAYEQHKTDAQRRHVLHMTYNHPLAENKTVHIVVTPHHYVLNKKMELQRADSFDVGDQLVFADYQKQKSTLVDIVSVESRCGYVTNSWAMNDYVVSNGIVFSSFSQLRFLGVDILEVKVMATVVQKILARLFLSKINALVDHWFVKAGLSVCGPAC